MDVFGQTVSARDDLGPLPTILRDERSNLVTSVTDARGNVTEFSYDDAGNLTSIRDAVTVADSIGGRASQFQYDPVFNRLVSAVDELGRQTLLDIDPANGNLRTITKVRGDVGGGDDVVTQLTYTAAGLIDTVTDPLGRVADINYDALGRITEIAFAVGTTDQATQWFEYDAAGNVTAVVDENSNRSEFQYDGLNRLTRILQPDPDGNGPLPRPR